MYFSGFAKARLFNSTQFVILFLCEIIIQMGVVKVHPLTDVMAECDERDKMA